MTPLIQRVPAHIQIYQTRAAYEAKTGKKAPPFDYSQPVKDWADSREFSDPDAEIEYNGIRYEANGEPVYDAARVVEQRSFRLFPEIANGVNLLPEPLPPQSTLTPNQLRMIQRKRPWPLELKPGERVVLAPGIGTVPVVDDNSSKPTGGECGACGEILEIVRRIAAKVGA